MATESSAGVHASRPPTANEQSLIDDILQLYQLNPSEETYSHYTPDAVFHDPVSIAKGLDSIKSQFNGMSKLFAVCLNTPQEACFKASILISR